MNEERVTGAIENIANILGIENVWEERQPAQGNIIYDMQRILKFLIQKSEFFDIVITLGKLESLPFDELINHATVVYEFRKLFRAQKRRLETKNQMIKDNVPSDLIEKEDLLIRECNDKMSDLRARHPYVSETVQKIERIEKHFPKIGGLDVF